MPQLDQNSEVEMALLKKEVEDQEIRLRKLEKDRDSALRWGIVVLGSSVLSMGAWIFKLLTVKAGLGA